MRTSLAERRVCAGLAGAARSSWLAESCTGEAGSDEMADGIRSGQIDLPHTDLAPRLARKLVNELASEVPQLAEDARVAVSELVTNAVVHTHPSEALRLYMRVDRAGSIYIAVSDESSQPPRLQTPDGDAEGGRGLQIIQQLSARWGYARDRRKGGKTVWLELRL
jgi:anti-sigma regulatory factor (Ser/Thr protein kinase)